MCPPSHGLDDCRQAAQHGAAFQHSLASKELLVELDIDALGPKITSMSLTYHSVRHKIKARQATRTMWGSSSRSREQVQGRPEKITIRQFDGGPQPQHKRETIVRRSYTVLPANR